MSRDYVFVVVFFFFFGGVQYICDPISFLLYFKMHEASEWTDKKKKTFSREQSKKLRSFQEFTILSQSIALPQET